MTSATPATGRTTLEDLAGELLLDILDYISIKNRYDIDFKTWEGVAEIGLRVSTLHSLALVSRKLHRIANPLLYSVLTHGGTALRRRQFLRTIVRRPDLAALVKEVRFSYFDWVADNSGLSPEFSDHLEAAQLDDTWDDNTTTAFKRALMESHNDSDVALLFSKLPNLTILEFDVDETWFHTWKWLLSVVRRAVATGSGPFSALRHLKAKYGNENASGFNPLFIQDFVGLPSLKSIEISGAYCEERDGGRPLSLLSNNNIQTLTFWSSSPGDDFVRCALEAFPQLKAFYFSWGDPLFMELEDFFQALRARRDTLEHITILTLSQKRNHWTQMIRRNVPVSPIGSFKDFASLKRLEITDVLLSGLAQYNFDLGPPQDTHFVDAPDYQVLVDVFPPSLEVLRIEYYGSCTEASAIHRQQFYEQLLKTISEMPNFCRLEILYHEDDKRDGEKDESLGWLVKTAGESGVAVDIIVWDKAKHEGFATAKVC